jgi:D-3-phosphoglycerate dehydrogenase
VTFRALVADPLSAGGLEILRDGGGVDVVVRDDISPEALLEAIPEFHALVVRSRTRVTRDVLASGRSLRVVGRSGVGLDNIDVEAARERGVAIVYAPGASAVSVAELAIGLVICLSRRIPDADRSTRGGLWERSRFVGRELSGKTLGVLGLGNIGREVARRAAPFGMRVLFHDPLRPRDAHLVPEAEEVPLTTLLESSDIVTVHVPLREGTRGLLDAPAIARMKPGAFLVNTARGGIVDEAALLAALRSGRIAGAALDVFETEPPRGSALLEEPNVIATPHIGASTREAQERVGREVARAVVRALRGSAHDRQPEVPKTR